MVRGGEFQIFDGETKFPRIIVLKFPSYEKAFELVFREFWIQRGKQPQGWNWQPSFQNTFGMSVPEFYERLKKYKRKDIKKILPSETLKIQDIFS